MKKTQITLSQAREGYILNAAARGLSKSTLRDYENTFKKFIDFVGETTPIDQITTQHVEQFLAQYAHLSKKTRLNYHTGLLALWTWAVGEKPISTNIVRALKPPKPESRTILPFTKSELCLLLGALERSRPTDAVFATIDNHPLDEDNLRHILDMVKRYHSATILRTSSPSRSMARSPLKSI